MSMNHVVFFSGREVYRLFINLGERINTLVLGKIYILDTCIQKRIKNIKWQK